MVKSLLKVLYGGVISMIDLALRIAGGYEVVGYSCGVVYTGL